MAVDSSVPFSANRQSWTAWSPCFGKPDDAEMLIARRIVQWPSTPGRGRRLAAAAFATFCKSVHTRRQLARATCSGPALLVQRVRGTKFAHAHRGGVL